MKVLFLCYYFPPMGMGGTQRSAKFVKYLPLYQWEPMVITVKDVHYYAHDDSLLDDINDAVIYRTESLDPLRLFARFKTPTGSTSAPSVNRNLFAKLNEFISGWFFIPDNKVLWLPFAIFRAFCLIHKYKIKVVYTTSPPQSAHLAGLMLKLLTSVRWVADFRDAWSDGESQASPTVVHSAVNRMLEKIVLKQADCVTGMCRQLTESLRKKSSLPEAKFTTITNGYDADDFKNALKVKISDKFTIAHLGSISRVSDPRPFLKAMRMLLDELPDLEKYIQVSFYGIDLFHILDEAIEQYQLGNIIAPVQYLSHSDALEKMMTSHLLLITILKKSNEEIITGKIFEYLGSGKSILMVTSSEGYVADIIRKLNRGEVLQYKDTVGIKKMIHTYYKAFKNRQLRIHEPISISQFDRKNIAGRLADVFNRAVK